LSILRSARAEALADAEGFISIVHSVELIGRQLSGKSSGIGGYASELEDLAANSSLCVQIPDVHKVWHARFENLLDGLRIARNDAVHQGTHARILTEHAIEVSIILEDALMPKQPLVSQIMARGVVQAEPKQPLSYVRQLMLKNAFSYLPIFNVKEWKLLSEFDLAQYLVAEDRDARLRELVETAISKGLRLQPAESVRPNDLVSSVIGRIDHRPLLVIDEDNQGVLLGVLTASDVL
jgi:CBS domain-containing protein